MFYWEGIAIHVDLVTWYLLSLDLQLAELCHIASVIDTHIFETHGYLLTNLSQPWLSTHWLQEFTDAVHPLNNCWGFINGTVENIFINRKNLILQWAQLKHLLNTCLMIQQAILNLWTSKKSENSSKSSWKNFAKCAQNSVWEHKKQARSLNEYFFFFL